MRCESRDDEKGTTGTETETRLISPLSQEGRPTISHFAFDFISCLPFASVAADDRWFPEHARQKKEDERIVS